MHLSLRYNINFSLFRTRAFSALPFVHSHTLQLFLRDTDDKGQVPSGLYLLFFGRWLGSRPCLSNLLSGFGGTKGTPFKEFSTRRIM